jgi:hypothetical protein
MKHVMGIVAVVLSLVGSANLAMAQSKTSQDHLSTGERAATRDCNLRVENEFHEYDDETNRYYTYLACMDEHGFNVSD